MARVIGQNTLAPQLRRRSTKGDILKFVIVSTPEHMARAIGKNTLPPQLRRRCANGND